MCLYNLITYATSSCMPCHYFLCYSFVLHWVCPAIMSLVIPLSLLNSFDINDNSIQHYSPLALMGTSKNSPPLTTMTKDNLLCLSSLYSFNLTWYWPLCYDLVNIFLLVASSLNDNLHDKFIDSPYHNASFGQLPLSAYLPLTCFLFSFYSL